MSEASPAGVVADAAGNWVDRHAPAWSRPYLRLARADRPIGSWLLLIPCWWSAALAGLADGALPNALHLVLFAIGAVAMRGAGCTWNDIVDRDIDAQVARTRSRPIPSGQVSVGQAKAFLALQLLVGLLVLVSLNTTAILVGLASSGLIIIYPFMKRVTWWPQFFLGLAFSWGALMGWAARFGALDWPAAALYGGSILWVIAYDTIYAHQDRDDDEMVGVKSTARLFGREHTKLALALLYGGALVLIGWALAMVGGGAAAFAGFLGFAAHLAWQIRRVDVDDAALCLGLFKSNRDAGLILFAGMVLDVLVQRFA